MKDFNVQMNMNYKKLTYTQNYLQTKSHGRNVPVDELQLFLADPRVILRRAVGEFEPQEAPKHTEAAC